MAFFDPEYTKKLSEAMKKTAEFNKKMQFYSLKEVCKRMKNAFILILVVAVLTYLVIIVADKIKNIINEKRAIKAQDEDNQKNVATAVKDNENNKIISEKEE